MNKVLGTTEDHECLRCGRILVAAASIARRHGPRCWARVTGAVARILAESRYKTEQVDKALGLIARGGIVRISRERPLFMADGSRGGTYLSEPDGCMCPAGLYAKHPCYHRIAADVLALAA